MNTLTKRTLSGIVYVILLLGCVLWNQYSFLALMLLFILVMMNEFMRMTMGNEYKASQVLSIITALMFFTLVWAVRAIPEVKAEFCFLAVIPMGAVMVNSLYVKDKSEFGKFANIYAALVYIALPITINNFLVMNKPSLGEAVDYNGILLVLFFVIIWVSDIGAYIFGMAFGQKYGKKLFPSISPKKSWIGFWGGMVMAVIFSVGFFFIKSNGETIWEIAGLQNFTWYHAIILAIVMNVAGVYGDLFESQWKRHYGVKDSGNIIPGHGGLLDRLDSAIFAIPVGVLYLSIFKCITTL